MIICRRCHDSNSLNGTPNPGVFECGSCGAAGQNAGFVIDGELQPLQKARAEKSFKDYVRSLLAPSATPEKR